MEKKNPFINQDTKHVQKKSSHVANMFLLLLGPGRSRRHTHSQRFAKSLIIPTRHLSFSPLRDMRAGKREKERERWRQIALSLPHHPTTQLRVSQDWSLFVRPPYTAIHEAFVLAGQWYFRNKRVFLQQHASPIFPAHFPPFPTASTLVDSIYHSLHTRRKSRVSNVYFCGREGGGSHYAALDILGKKWQASYGCSSGQKGVEFLDCPCPHLLLPWKLLPLLHNLSWKSSGGGMGDGEWGCHF